MVLLPLLLPLPLLLLAFKPLLQLLLLLLIKLLPLPLQLLQVKPQVLLKLKQLH